MKLNSYQVDQLMKSLDNDGYSTYLFLSYYSGLDEDNYNFSRKLLDRRVGNKEMDDLYEDILLSVQPPLRAHTFFAFFIALMCAYGLGTLLNNFFEFLGIQ